MGTFALLWLAVSVAAFVQGTTGIGFALIAAPVMGLLQPSLLPVGLLALMLPLNVVILWRERGWIDGAGVGWITVGRVAGTGAGLAVLLALTPGQLSAFVGLATLAAALASMLVPPFEPTRPAYLVSGAITGVTETATGIGGPPLALLYQHQPPAVLRSTLALCFFLGELLSLSALALTDKVETGHLVTAVQLLPASALGFAASAVVHRRVQGRFLRLFVLAFASVSGLVLLIR